MRKYFDDGKSKFRDYPSDLADTRIPRVTDEENTAEFLSTVTAGPVISSAKKVQIPLSHPQKPSRSLRWRLVSGNVNHDSG